MNPILRPSDIPDMPSGDVKRLNGLLTCAINTLPSRRTETEGIVVGGVITEELSESKSEGEGVGVGVGVAHFAGMLRPKSAPQ